MKSYVFALLALVLAGCGREDTEARSTPSEPPVGGGVVVVPVSGIEPTDAQRNEGAALASQGANGVAACVACHGLQGEGKPASGFPRLAGQPYGYLVEQMQAYAQGTRAHPVMGPIAISMTDSQRIAVAAYYAALR